MNLASQLATLKPTVRQIPNPTYELVKGYSVMGLPFSTGHLLALRVWNETDFAPFTSVWHRAPNGDWSIFVDGVSLETGCSRYWGKAAKHNALANIDVSWTAPNTLRVTMDDPALDWTMTLTSSPILNVMNPVSVALPEWTWEPKLLLTAREAFSKHVLGMGDIQMSFTTPSGHPSLIMPEQIYLIEAATATFDGLDLGQPTVFAENPQIGGVPLPRKGVFAIGEAHADIVDLIEFKATQKAVRAQRVYEQADIH